MTLAGRLLLFFLATLALVLVGFSLTLFLLARSHLYRQLDDRLQATLNTLTAAAEVHPHGVEWEVNHRLVAADLGNGMPMMWLVRDGDGRQIDGSKGVNSESPFASIAGDGRNTAFGAPQFDPREDVHWRGETWRVRGRQLQGGGKMPRDAQPDEGVGKTYPVLAFSVGASLAPIAASLRMLALVLTALTIGLWSAAALLGRRLCTRALLPLARMAATARSITAAGLDRRLADTGTKDELAELGKAFNDLLANLQDSFERQRRFTGDAAHQMRTPLTALIGQIDVALRRERPAEEYQRVLALLHKQATQLRHIVEMLLFLARADAESILPHFETIPIDAWLNEHLQPRLSGENIRLEIATESAFAVRAHASLLGQLVDNLLDNAHKYDKTGTPISIKVWRESGWVCVAVKDQGSGIAPADLPHVFEPFFRSSAARRDGVAGVGLGLAVAKRIAEAFHGTLEAASILGKGSCFTLRLPAAEDMVATTKLEPVEVTRIK